MLAAFYGISWRTFWEIHQKSTILMKYIRLELGTNKDLAPELLSVFEPAAVLPWPVIGFALGAGFGLIVFLWIANVERPSDARSFDS